MFYFGKNWGAPICQVTESKPIPIGETCYHCDEVIQDGDRGFLIPMAFLSGQESKESFEIIHLECFIRTAVGSLGHLHKKCSCYGGTEEDPSEMTRRQAAIAAFNEFNRQQNYSDLKTNGNGISAPE